MSYHITDLLHVASLLLSSLILKIYYHYLSTAVIRLLAVKKRGHPHFLDDLFGFYASMLCFPIIGAIDVILLTYSEPD